MQNYMLNMKDNILIINLIDGNNNILEEIKSTKDTFFNEIDKMINSLNTIEKFKLIDDKLTLKTIRFDSDDTYIEEEISFILSNKLLRNKSFIADLYQRLNKYNAIVRQETLNNITTKKCSPAAVKKRLLTAN